MTDKSSLPPRLALLALLCLSSAFCIWKSRRLRRARLSPPNPSPSPSPNPNPNPNPKIFFASETGTSETLARRLAGRLRASGAAADLVDPHRYEPEDLSKETLVLIVASTWEDGRPPPNAEFLARWLAESAADFRVGSLLLSRCQFAVFGVGSRSYEPTFNAAARDFSRWMRSLGADEVIPVENGDVDSGDLDATFESWTEKVVGMIKGGFGEERSVAPELETDGFDESDEATDDDVVESGVVDMEDIAGKATSRKSSGATAKGDNGVKEMVTPIIRTSLEKQGYKIIGSHSGVKLCRWTKSQLRGRGGCYKHSFYGIESHR